MAVGGPGALIRSIVSGRIVVNLLVSSADLLTAFGAGAKVYLERDTSSAFSAPTVVSSTTIVSGTEQLEFVDTSGTSSSWYRVRVGNSGGTTYGDYSDGVQATSLLAYATLDDLLKTVNVAPSDTAKLNLLADYLVDAADLLTQLCSRSFFRNPQVSGTSTWTWRVKRGQQKSLVAAIGKALDIASITTLEVADDLVGTSWTTIVSGSTGYYLDPTYPEDGQPYTDVLLSRDGANYTTFPAYGQVRLTGVRGFASVPPLVKRANIDQARKWFQQQAAGEAPTGMSALGQPIFGPGTPHTVRRVWELYRRMTFSYV